MLAVGAELFAEHVVGTARRIGLTTFGLAVLLAGAEPEEALVAGLASARGRPDLAAGDVLGANLVIATLTLGLVMLVAPIVLSAAVRRYAAAAALASGFAALLLIGGVTRGEGLLLAFVYVVAVAGVWRLERRPPSVGEAGKIHASGSRYGAPLLAFGLAGMVAGGVLAVLGAERMVAATGLGDGPIGLTLLALATSAEMLALVPAARRHGVEDVAVAGVLGAVAYNATFSLAVGALVAPLDLAATRSLLAVSAVVIAVCAVVTGWPRAALGGAFGVVLALTYAVAVAFVLA